MFKNLDNMKLKKRLNHGYAVVIMLMIISGILNIISLGVLYGTFNSYVNGSQKADTAVKECKIDVNLAARSIREMALQDDASTYDSYRTTVEEKLNDVGTQLEIIKKTKVIDNELYNEYSTALTNWGTIGYDIMSDIESGNKEMAASKILDQCAPALDTVEDITDELDKITDDAKSQAIQVSRIITAAAFLFIILFVVAAAVLAQKIGKRIIASILTPLREIETVAKELSAGNLHSNIEYHSNDEIGGLAHSLRKSIRILGEYVDDIARAMQEFSSGNFDVQPEVEWKGDFVDILNAFMSFEQSMSDTVKGIQGVANQVSGGAEQVAESSTELAEGASNQASVVEELTATLENIAERVAQNADHAMEISRKVQESGAEIVNGNEKMQEMVASMQEINRASGEISKIIATINDIAAQTNLLALNASIEAARAGEAGKGFAVVADQVSVLATQSADAAKESTVLIEASVQAVEKGMVIANETAQQLESVAAGSKIITSHVNDVASALKEQTATIAEMNEGVGQINDVVQSNSATSEECAAASQEMSSQAESLEELIAQFRIAETE
ncbi:MAG: methyl-accepting chemotaxis protein [Eubacteriales bacterium]|nr:methyl-accepting chemotaxis protein [Eubacteriales bacterium]